MGLIDRLRSVVYPPPMSGVDLFSPYAFLANGSTYPLDGLNLTMPESREEEIEASFTSYVRRGYKGNAIIFALMRDRMALFSQARFTYRDLRTGKLYGNQSLGILEHPWANGSTQDLLARAITDADIAGNFYCTIRKGQIKRFRPDWVTMVYGTNDPNVSADDIDSEFLGIIYYPGGEYSGSRPQYFLRSEIAHFAPLPDPEAHVRGMSWITPIVREIMADGAATTHKLKFFENGATPQMIVKRADAPTKEKFDEWKSIIDSGHNGAANAYRTLYLTAGADATVVGKDLQQLEFKATQGAGETRMAAASGISPVIASLSEGMQGSALNAGNYGAARRNTADKTLWWLWGNFCGSMETLVPPPAGSQLWIDGSEIPFLREDRKDAAAIQQIKAASIRQLVDAGYKPESVVAAVDAEDMTLLKHSGLFSVQLQPPMPDGPPPPTIPSTNGTNGKTPIPAGGTTA